MYSRGKLYWCPQNAKYFKAFQFFIYKILQYQYWISLYWYLKSYRSKSSWIHWYQFFASFLDWLLYSSYHSSNYLRWDDSDKFFFTHCYCNIGRNINLILNQKYFAFCVHHIIYYGINRGVTKYNFFVYRLKSCIFNSKNICYNQLPL